MEGGQEEGGASSALALVTFAWSECAEVLEMPSSWDDPCGSMAGQVDRGLESYIP